MLIFRRDSSGWRTDRTEFDTFISTSKVSLAHSNRGVQYCDWSRSSGSGLLWKKLIQQYKMN